MVYFESFFGDFGVGG